MALAHNGNLVNSSELRRALELEGSIFHMTSDTEVISYIIIKERITSPSIEEAVSRAMNRLRGAYSLVIMSPTKLIAVRDENGFRPLCIGRRDDGAVIVASETCALDAVGATFVRDVDPGEIVVIDKDGMRSIRDHCGKAKQTTCIFEYIYFARPDSVIDGKSVHEARIRAGEFLARDYPVDADIVVGVPDSGIDAAIGYSRASGIPYEIGFIKNKYIARTFISPGQSSPMQYAASVWFWWTIPSSEARRANASSVCSATREQKRFTCGFPHRLSSIPAITVRTLIPGKCSSPATTRWRRSRPSSARIRSDISGWTASAG